MCIKEGAAILNSWTVDCAGWVFCFISPLTGRWANVYSWLRSAESTLPCPVQQHNSTTATTATTEPENRKLPIYKPGVYEQQNGENGFVDRKTVYCGFIFLNSIWIYVGNLWGGGILAGKLTSPIFPRISIAFRFWELASSSGVEKEGGGGEGGMGGGVGASAYQMTNFQ